MDSVLLLNEQEQGLRIIQECKAVLFSSYLFSDMLKFREKRESL